MMEKKKIQKTGPNDNQFRPDVFSFLCFLFCVFLCRLHLLLLMGA